MQCVTQRVQKARAHPRAAPPRGTRTRVQRGIARRVILGRVVLMLSSFPLPIAISTSTSIPVDLPICGRLHSRRTRDPPAPKRLLQPLRLALALFKILELFPLVLEAILRQLILHVLLMAVDEQFSDDGRELGVFV